MPALVGVSITAAQVEEIADYLEVSRRMGHTPDERFHVDRHHALHDVAALILVDLSFSTESYLDDARVRDVKQAIETDRLHGIGTHAFAVDRQARESFPQMFTRHHYHVVARPQARVASMCELFCHLQAG